MLAATVASVMLTKYWLLTSAWRYFAEFETSQSPRTIANIRAGDGTSNGEDIKGRFCYMCAWCLLNVGRYQ